MWGETYHSAEVLSYELAQQFRTSVSVGNVAAGEDLVGEFGTCFECERFREDEGVVAIEKECSDLWQVSIVNSFALEGIASRR